MRHGAHWLQTSLAGLLATAVVCGTGAMAEDAPQAAEPPGIEALSTPLRELLAQEMVHLQTGMMTMVPAFVSGDWALVAETGKQMEHSYIMRQALTPGQRDELHRLLPVEFRELDRQFHYLAGMLSHAASARKAELAAFYYSRMLETCVACHMRYASAKFPALGAAPAEPADEHHH